jgi:hypothetical protein
MNRMAATDIISCPSFEREAAPGSKNTLNEISGELMSGELDALEGIPETLVLAQKMMVVAQRRGEILDMVPRLKTAQVQRATTPFPSDQIGSFYSHIFAPFGLCSHNPSSRLTDIRQVWIHPFHGNRRQDPDVAAHADRQSGQVPKLFSGA